MSSLDELEGPPSRSIADKLVLACSEGDARSAAVAIAAGACVNVMGSRGEGTLLPLSAAVDQQRLPIMLLLLANGADANVPAVLMRAACDASVDVFQLLIDGGGDVNCDGGQLLFLALFWSNREVVAWLLAHPGFALAAGLNNPGDGLGVVQFARENGGVRAADAIAAEVSAGGPCVWTCVWCAKGDRPCLGNFRCVCRRLPCCHRRWRDERGW